MGSRKITKDAYDAFIKRVNFSRDNTKVVIDENRDAKMYLYGFCIAKTEGPDIYVSHCGYPTATTTNRLSCFTPMFLSKGVIYMLENKYASFYKPMPEGWVRIDVI